MSEEALLTILFMFVVLCITIYNMHSNHLNHTNNLGKRKNKGLKEHREKWDWIWKEHERQLFETDRIQEKSSEDPIPTKKGNERTYDKFERPSDKTMENLFGAGRKKEPPSEELLEKLRGVAKKNKDGEDHMASVEEQIQEIQTKDELIKWLINEYVFLSIKVYGTENEQVLLQELMSLQGKFKKLNEE